MTKAYALPLKKFHVMSTKTFFFVTLALLITLFATYIYFVNKTIMNVVAREKTQNTLSSLSTTIGGLEYKYITLKNGVTVELAHAKGFIDFSPTTYLARQNSRPALSYNSLR